MLVTQDEITQTHVSSVSYIQCVQHGATFLPQNIVIIIVSKHVDATLTSGEQCSMVPLVPPSISLILVKLDNFLWRKRVLVFTPTPIKHKINKYQFLCDVSL